MAWGTVGVAGLRTDRPAAGTGERAVRIPSATLERVHSDLSRLSGDDPLEFPDDWPAPGCQTPPQPAEALLHSVSGRLTPDLAAAGDGADGRRDRRHRPGTPATRPLAAPAASPPEVAPSRSPLLPPGCYLVTHADNRSEAQPLQQAVTVTERFVHWDRTGEELPLRRGADGSVRMPGARLQEGQRVRVARPVAFTDGDSLEKGDLGTVVEVYHALPPDPRGRALRVGDEVRAADGRKVKTSDAKGVPGAWELPAGEPAVVEEFHKDGRVRLTNPGGCSSRWFQLRDWRHADGAPFPGPAAVEAVANLRMDAVRGQAEFCFCSVHSVIDRELWVVRQGGRFGQLVKWSNGDVWRRVSDDASPAAAAAGADDHPGPHPVYCNVYHIPTEGLLSNLAEFSGLASYHTGVEICGMEWWFGGAYDASKPEQPGIECCAPGQCAIGDHVMRIPMGETQHSSAEISRIVARLAKGEWQKGAYHLLLRNCNHFADVLLESLGVSGRLPDWVNRAARWGGAVVPGRVYDKLAREKGAQQGWDEAQREACGCGQPFTLLHRRHHCRACGGVFCGRCTKGRRVLPMHGPLPVRVCVDCSAQPADAQPAAPPAAAPPAAAPG